MAENTRWLTQGQCSIYRNVKYFNSEELVMTNKYFGNIGVQTLIALTAACHVEIRVNGSHSCILD